MPREVSEWIGGGGKISPPPPRVKLRIIDRQGGRCACCGTKLGLCGERIEFDHIVALINGGEHRESNIQALRPACHAKKTASDVAEKSKVARKRKKSLGLDKPKSRLPGSRGDIYKRKIGGGVVLRKEDD
jgi:5-methylcytosine-specific restriction protein A